jgi:hypothetical protein
MRVNVGSHADAQQIDDVQRIDQSPDDPQNDVPDCGCINGTKHFKICKVNP